MGGHERLYLHNLVCLAVPRNVTGLIAGEFTMGLEASASLAFSALFSISFEGAVFSSFDFCSKMLQSTVTDRCRQPSTRLIMTSFNVPSRSLDFRTAPNIRLHSATENTTVAL